MISPHPPNTTRSKREAESSHPQISTTSESQLALARPEFFRLPSRGGDPYFGLTRSFYYEGEKRGYWPLVRLRERGKVRGVTLVPYDAVSSFVRSQAGGAAIEKELTLSPNVGFRQFVASQIESGK
jgi:hypothetical protein